MGLLGKLFEKKECDFCGGEIGMLGNRKLEDGNMCKECARKLSPWFEERRHSTVAQIQQQLDLREANRQAVAEFCATRTIGKTMKVYIDENAGKFMVCREKERNNNPDVIDLSCVTNVSVAVDENRTEEFRKDSEGQRKSYVPPRYTYRYNLRLSIYLRHPYLDEIDFDINDASITTNSLHPLAESQKPDPHINNDFRECERLGMEIR